MNQTNNSSRFQITIKAVLFCSLITFAWKIFLFINQSTSFVSNGLLIGLIGTCLAGGVTYLFLRADKKRFADIGLKMESGTWKKFAAGVLIGIALITLLVIFIAYISNYQIEQTGNANWLFILLTALPPIGLLATMEEITFRCYPQIILKDSLGILPSLAITSVLFGTYHLVFGWGVIGFLSTTIWGFLFCSMAISSNGISLPSGFHTAINLTQSIFGLNGNSFSVWHINGARDDRFLQNQQMILMLAPIVILAFWVIWIRRKR